ncbi:DEKNAAC101656 [Brettanomyces naardenensis]|uniref:RING-type E3 ubiquitin transferase n=1 Tax=Brettanomyces naardenensis TaxID=13370 RepID=A0A448YJ46_BRENA|nr:DEKNAAC101656 [Brettanomyces naardenensis]
MDIGTPWERAEMFFQSTWMRGLIIIAKYTFVLGSMMLIQGSILSDEGFTKIVHKKIGPEPRVNRLFEILHRQQLRRLNGNHRIDNNNNAEVLPRENEGEALDLDDVRRIVEDANRILREDRGRDNVDNEDLLANVDPREMPEVDAPAMAAADADDDLNNRLFDTDKGPAFVFQIAVFLDVVAIGALMCLKTIPSLLGMATIGVLDSVVRFLYSLLQSWIASTYAWTVMLNGVHRLLSSATVQNAVHYSHDSRVLSGLATFFGDNLIVPAQATYRNTVNWTPSTDAFERRSVVAIGLAVILFFILSVMRKMEQGCSQNNPLSGGYRSVYVVLLELVCVLKVFALVMIEWLIFPLFCGYQIEFALVPFFNENVYTYKIEPPLLGTLVDLGYAPQWFLGTFFMYFFAAFVSMIRSGITRKGVMFFIRPSDDPNIRLVHDALMRPFTLKLSHIALSGLVYSLYILVEFTMVTWGVRLYSPIEILPASPRFWSIERVGYLALFFVGSMAQDQIVNYWKWAIKFSCAKLRLSSFLVGNDVASERGHVLYRSFLHWLLWFGKAPDYSNPVLEHEAAKYFADHPDASCCFVPDGNYVRAPDNDQVSHSFVKELFVPVTKDDKLLAPIPPIQDDEERYNPYGDEELVNITSYVIVYRPPKFRDRIFLLLGMMWFFSMLITFFLYLSGVLVATASESIEPFKIDFWRMLVAIFLLVQLPKFYRLLVSQKQAVLNTFGVDPHAECSLTFATRLVKQLVSVPVRNAVLYLHDRREQLKIFLLIVVYAAAEFVVLFFGIVLPGKCLDQFAVELLQKRKAWILQLYRFTAGLFVFISTNYLGGLVVSFTPRFSVSFNIRYQVFWISMGIVLMWTVQLGYYVTNHPDDDFDWLLEGSSERDSLTALLDYWINLAAEKNVVCHACCLALWIVFLMRELLVKAYDLLGRMNTQLKEEFYSSGKVLANASDDDDERHAGDVN